MKQKFINGSIGLIYKYHPEYSQDKLDEVKYGLESIYLTTTKMIILSLLALRFNIFFEMIAMLLSINLFRCTGYGLHANSSFKCLLYSGLILLVSSFFVYDLNISLYFKSAICIACIICFYFFAPADTEKFPILKKENREKLKFRTVIKSIIASFVILLSNNLWVGNTLLIGMFIETILILPVTYFLADQPYANYEAYLIKDSKEV